jgi:hypothetical protein
MGGKERRTSWRFSEYGSLVFFVFFILEKFGIFLLFSLSVAMIRDLCSRTTARHINLLRVIEQLFEFGIYRQ